MKRILLILLMLSSWNVFGANFVLGEGKFLSESGDSYNFVKQQLEHECIKDIISKELQTLNLNHELFWKKYGEKLEQEFAPTVDMLKESYKVNGPDASPENLLKFNEAVRTRKLKFRRTFLGLNNLMVKFVPVKIARSPRNPKLRIMKIEGEVNKSLLSKTYYNLIKGKKSSDFGTLYINANFDLQGVSYTELGVENEKDFKGEILKNWLSWFNQNKPINISKIEILTQEKEDKLVEFFKVPSESAMEAIPEEFMHTLLLDIEIKVVKKEFEKQFNSYSFDYSGSAFLRDLHSNFIVSSHKFGSENKNYKIATGISLANLVANHVYQMAKGYFPKFKENISEISPISNIFRLKVAKFDNVKQVKDLIKILNERGIKHSLKAKLDSLSQESADILLYFDGDYTDIKSLVQESQAAKKDLQFEIIDTGSQFGIKFIKETETL